jgi:hypothetical protein
MANKHQSIMMDSTFNTFNGFSQAEILGVPATIWECFQRKNSFTIKCNDEQAFNLLEDQVKQMYGEPECKLEKHGIIYRGPASTSVPLEITLLSTPPCLLEFREQDMLCGLMKFYL